MRNIQIFLPNDSFHTVGLLLDYYWSILCFNGHCSLSCNFSVLGIILQIQGNFFTDFKIKHLNWVVEIFKEKD